jgi:hypothetical protein
LGERGPCIIKVTTATFELYSDDKIFISGRLNRRQLVEFKVTWTIGTQGSGIEVETEMETRLAHAIGMVHKYSPCFSLSKNYHFLSWQTPPIDTNSHLLNSSAS